MPIIRRPTWPGYSASYGRAPSLERRSSAAGRWQSRSTPKNQYRRPVRCSASFGLLLLHLSADSHFFFALASLGFQGKVASDTALALVGQAQVKRAWDFTIRFLTE